MKVPEFTTVEQSKTPESVPVAMSDYLSSLLQAQMDEKVKAELSFLLIIYIRARKYGIDSYNDALRVCAASLTSASPHIECATMIRKEISRLLKSDILTHKLFGSTPLSRVMIGLYVLLFFIIPLSATLKISTTSTVFSIPTERLVGPIALGILGSIFSILTRISEFSTMSFPDPLVPFLLGFLKPMIGGISALFIVLVLESKICYYQYLGTGCRLFLFANIFRGGIQREACHGLHL
jgi:hypothetical protein